MKKVSLPFILLFILSAFQLDSFAQTFPVLGSVLAGHTQNVVNTGLTDNTPLTIQNTGSVPLRFCMSGSATAGCVSTGVGLVVNAATTVNITVADLGGINSGAYLNVTNEALLIVGNFKVDRSGSVLPCVPTARWNPGCNNTQVDLPANYLNTVPVGTFVGIGISTVPTANLQVSGTQRLDGTFTHTGSLVANGDVTRTGNSTQTGTFSLTGAFSQTGNQTITGNQTLNGNHAINGNITQTGTYTSNGAITVSADNLASKLVLNATSDAQAKSQLSFQQRGVEVWSLGVDPGANNNKGFFLFNSSNNTTPFYVSPTGKIGINTATPSEDYALSVNGNVRVKLLRVNASSNWGDYVFEENYKMPSLSELEAYIKLHKHLPEIPAATEVETQGADVSEMLKKQMVKIEELTLYMIEQQKQIEKQQQELNQLKKKLKTSK